MIKVAVLGHGVVGSGVVELFEKNKQSICSRAGEDIEVKYILDIRDFPDLPYHEKFTKDFNIILNDPEVRIVAEVIGGLSPAFGYTKTLLEHGKSVVTSNKELVAAKGAELLQIAKEHNVNFFFEASVGGGIPIIRPMHQCLAANEISEIAGILNGTTNFILTKMVHDQMAFDDALKMAQQLGYAERDPTADIEGHDTCRKICILASLAFGHHVYPKDVYTEGISGLTLADIAYAQNWGGVIKLIGRARRLENGRLHVMVAPSMFSSHSQLANIDDVFNGILIRGDATGDVVFYGKGAGKFPTASAVVADIIDIAKSNSTSKSLSWKDSGESMVDDYKSISEPFFLRVTTADVAAAKAAIADTFPDCTILSRNDQPQDEFALVTQPMTEYKLEEKLAALCPDVAVQSAFRVLDY